MYNRVYKKYNLFLNRQSKNRVLKKNESDNKHNPLFVILSAVERSEILRFRFATLRMTTDNSSLTRRYSIFPQGIKKITNCRQSMQKNDLKTLRSQPKTQPQVNMQKQALCRNPHNKKLLQTVLTQRSGFVQQSFHCARSAQCAQRKLICYTKPTSYCSIRHCGLDPQSPYL